MLWEIQRCSANFTTPPCFWLKLIYRLIGSSRLQKERTQLQKSPGFHRTLLSCLQISSPLKNEISILCSSANFMRWPSLSNSHFWLQILHFRNFEKGTHIAPFFYLISFKCKMLDEWQYSKPYWIKLAICNKIDKHACKGIPNFLRAWEPFQSKDGSKNASLHQNTPQIRWHLCAWLGYHKNILQI